MPTLDDLAFEDCYRRSFPLVLAKCRRMLRDDAESTDLAQEVFVRLWKHRALLEEPMAVTAWLYRTSTRLVIDRVRQRSLGQESMTHLLSLAQTTRDSESLVLSREQLRALVSKFPAQELEAAILNRFDGLVHQEVGEVMNISERTVRRLLFSFDERVIATQELG